MDIAALTASTPSTDSEIAKKSLSENFDQFLTMLTVQLQNQDPLSPMDSSEFTNQLVMFSQLEQDIKANENIEQVIALQKSAEVTAALSYLGKDVKAASSIVYLDGGKTEFSYDMPAGADTASVTIFDADGKIVTILPAEKVSGQHTDTWDGKDAQGVLQSDGIYSILVSAVDKDDIPLPQITVYFKGTATGVTQENGETLVQVGPVDIPVGAIVSASNPNEPADE